MRAIIVAIMKGAAVGMLGAVLNALFIFFAYSAAFAQAKGADGGTSGPPTLQVDSVYSVRASFPSDGGAPQTAEACANGVLTWPDGGSRGWPLLVSCVTVPLTASDQKTFSAIASDAGVFLRTINGL